jgi:acyl dehydratase
VADAPARWTVGTERQSAFATFTGDRNPLHLDPVAASRLPFGRVAVHGLHLLLDALDRVALATGRSPRRVRCTFRHPVGVGDEIVTTIVSGATDEASASVVVDVWEAADIRVEFGGTHDRYSPVAPLPAGGEPEIHDLASLAGRSGAIPIALDAGAIDDWFPHLTAQIGAGALAELLALTRLVGMHVPGLRSLFSSLDVTLGTGPTSDDRSLHYRVDRVDERFSQVSMSVRGPTLTGTLTAFLRPEPVEQVVDHAAVDADEFAGQRWLVVGGSRGLGAATVGLLLAGGAEVHLTGLHTSFHGAPSATGPRHVHRYDVRDPVDLLVRQLDRWRPDHLAYFATPAIFDGTAGAYSDRLHQRFREIYVDRFRELVERLVPDGLVGVLWPSSTALDTTPPGLAEYADAKRAGELECVRLAAAHAGLFVHAPRLPRLLTDQTTTYVPTEFGDTSAELRSALRGVTNHTAVRP